MIFQMHLVGKCALYILFFSNSLDFSDTEYDYYFARVMQIPVCVSEDWLHWTRWSKVKSTFMLHSALNGVLSIYVVAMGSDGTW